MTKNYFLVTLLFFSVLISHAEIGVDWTVRTSPADTIWRSVIYGNGMFVAVGQTSNTNSQPESYNKGVITSTDGVNWTIREGVTTDGHMMWNSVTYGNGLFVAVGYNSVMTSSDGINWTSRDAASDNDWESITYGNGLFVAVSRYGLNNQVMTSPNGITWTSRDPAFDNIWLSVTYGNGLFVAVGGGSVNQVMTSPDGITWTSRDPAPNNLWQSVTYGNDLFVAAANTSGSNDKVMTSPDGIMWTGRNVVSNLTYDWTEACVTYGNGLFVAFNAGNSVATSTDGITWVSGSYLPSTNWSSVSATYGNGIFVAVGENYINENIMTSGELTVSTNEVAKENALIYVANNQIVVKGENIQNAQLSIYSLSGQIIQTHTINGNTTIPVNFNTGIYIVTLENEGELTRKKIIIE